MNVYFVLEVKLNQTTSNMVNTDNDNEINDPNQKSNVYVIFLGMNNGVRWQKI